MDTDLLTKLADTSANVVLTISKTTVPSGTSGSFENTFELTLTSNSTSVDFGDGTATVTVSTELESGYSYYIDENGNKTERIALVISDSTASWTTTHFSTWALSENEYEIDDDSGGSGSGSSGDTDDYFLDDGNYYVDISLYNATSNEESMGDVAFANNDQALITVEDGVVTIVQIATNPVDVSGYHSAIITFEVDDAQVSVLKTGEVTTSSPTDSSIATYDYVKLVEFEMPEEGQPDSSDEVTYVAVTFYVPDTPMDEVVDAANGLNARVRFQWSSAEETSDTSLSVNDSTASGTSSITGDSIEALSLTDTDTGIKLVATTEELDDDAELSITILSEGDDYDTAARAMRAVTDEWSLYKIVTLVDDEETDPDGSVTLYFPCTDDGLTVYRINSSGTKTVLKGAVEDGYYVLSTSSLGLFAVVGELAEATVIESSGFSDVPDDHWAKDYISAAVEQGLFAGTSETEFSPRRPHDTCHAVHGAVPHERRRR